MDQVLAQLAASWRRILSPSEVRARHPELYCPIHALIDGDFLVKFMITQDFVAQAVSEDNRVAMPKINQAALSDILVPVPPLAEQRRIVAKISELMALCDRLEANLAERRRHAPPPARRAARRGAGAGRIGRSPGGGMSAVRTERGDMAQSTTRYSLIIVVLRELEAKGIEESTTLATVVTAILSVKWPCR